MISMITVFLISVFAITIFLVYDLSGQDKQTSVGSIYLGGIEEEQYQQILTNEINDYLNELDYHIEYQGESISLPSSLFTPNINETIIQMNENTKNSVIFSIEPNDQSIILTRINSMFTQNYMTLMDTDKLFNDLLNDLGNMVMIKAYQLEDYFVESAFNQSLYFDVVSGINSADVTQIIGQIGTITIEPNSRFSLLETLKDYDLTNEQLSVIATGMLKVLTHTHMNGFMFHTYPEESLWSTLGYNVRILKVNGYDFTFYNDDDYEYRIELNQSFLNAIEFNLKGYPQVFDYEVSVNKSATVPIDDIYIDNDELTGLTPGVVVETTDTEVRYVLLVEAGEEGGVYTVYRTVTKADGTSLIEKLYDVYIPSKPNIYEIRIDEIGGV